MGCLSRPPLYVFACLFLKNSTSVFGDELRGFEPWHAEFGMPVKVVWADPKDRRGAITDFHFEPAEGWTSEPMNPEKERIKKLCNPVYVWVKSLK